MNIKRLIFDNISGKGPLIIAGPCSAESRVQVLTTAQKLAQCGVRIFRAGIWKARTKPGGFEGVGTVGLSWLKEVKESTGMLTATEVATPLHVREAVKAGIDILWIGARTVTNPFAIQDLADSLAGSDIYVLVKNPVNPDLDLWIGAIERLYSAGVEKIGAIHRGFSLYGKRIYRNEPIWQIPIELKRRYPELTLICDPSHIGGRKEFVANIARQALDLRFDGLMIESHCYPDSALSDAGQQITPEELKDLLSNLIVRNNGKISEDISFYRKQIDEIDYNLLTLLSDRMNISNSIGKYKKGKNMPVLQSARYNEILELREKMGEKFGLRREFVDKLIKLLHEESVNVQLENFSDKA